MKKYLFITILLLLGLSVNATCDQDYLSHFNEANTAYEKGNFKQAVKKYELLISLDQNNLQLYYNLGNAYYKNGILGKAILNYERAKRLSPLDKEIKHNLAFIRNLVGEPEIVFPESFNLWLTSIFTLNTLSIINSTIFVFLISGLILLMFTKSQILKVLNIALTLLLIISSGWTFLQISEEVLTEYAIIVSENTNILNGPGTDNSIAFSLPQGRKVIVLNRQNNWTAIEIPKENLRGWVNKNDIDSI